MLARGVDGLGLRLPREPEALWYLAWGSQRISLRSEGRTISIAGLAVDVSSRAPESFPLLFCSMRERQRKQESCTLYSARNYILQFLGCRLGVSYSLNFKHHGVEGHYSVACLRCDMITILIWTCFYGVQSAEYRVKSTD